MKPETLEDIGSWGMILIGLTLALLAMLYFFPPTNAELSTPGQQDITDLEKSKMQTVYEDDKKKVMLPYDPDKVMTYIMIAIILAFGSGVITGYAAYKYKRKSI